MAEVEKPLMDAVNAVPDIQVDKLSIQNANESTDNCKLSNISSTENLVDNTQVKTNTSHPHDSEYDTASDLEGANDYDDDDNDEEDDDDDDDDDANEDEEDDEEEELEEEEYDDDETDDSISDDDKESVIDDDVENIEGANVLRSTEKIERNIPKKVDEDRRNPQYIPKKGTFYEHDDRTADYVEPKGFLNKANSGNLVLSISGTSSTAGYKSNPSLKMPAASKSTRGWRAASSSDPWCHDRFDAKEQAPKTRAELVSSYGYDIRTEDAPPKAHRRKRYARGPNKYMRNWEDESAYLKTNNKERRTLRQSDFPPLSDKSIKPRISRQNEEKENRMHKRQQDNRLERNERATSRRRNFHNDDHKETKESRTLSKPRNNFKPQGHRQVAMEFRQRKSYQTRFNQSTSAGNNFNNNNNNNINNNSNNRLETTAQRQNNTNTHIQVSVNANAISDHLQKNIPKQPQMGGSKYRQNPSPQRQHQADNHNNDSEGANDINKYEQEPSNHPIETHHPSPPLINQISRQGNQITAKLNATSSLAQRLQQLQNRNEPSHVGSVQMHSVASQNKQQLHKQPQQPPQQQQQQQQQQHQVIVQPQANNMLLNATTLHSALPPPEQRGPPKRYSSLRRSQHEAQHIPDPQQQHNHQHQLQQLHLQQQQQQQQQQQPQMMLADQHILQANLMQLYHQENLQAQMQALQVSQGAITNKQSTYTPVPAGVPPGSAPPQAAGPYAAPPPPQAAYYVATPEAYAAAAAASTVQNPTPSQYTQQQQTPNYLPQSQTSANVTLAYGASSTAGQPFSVLAQPGAVPVTTSNFQNYNTVGGTTYFVPPPTQAAIRPLALPQRRPNNAIPILPPTEKNKTEDKQLRTYELKDETKNTNTAESQNPQVSAVPPDSSVSNIDHIIDNMFVQRPTYQPPNTSAAIPPTQSEIAGSDSNLSTIAYTAINSNNEKYSSSATDDNTTNDANTIENNSNDNNKVTLAEQE